MSSARPWSLSAPATISEAEAEPPFTSTTSGAPSMRSPGVASIRKRASEVRPSAVTMTPESRKSSATATPASSTPPGLLRRSSTKPFDPAGLSRFRRETARLTSSAVVSLKLVMRR